MTDTYKGSCVCGAVEIEVHGTPRRTGYCHCSDCRGYLGAPINGFSLWNYDQFSILGGEEHLEGYAKTPHTIRKRCGKCGSALFSDHPDKGFVDVFASVLKNFDHDPQVHVYYEERMLDVLDGLPKFRKRPDRNNPEGDMGETER